LANDTQQLPDEAFKTKLDKQLKISNESGSPFLNERSAFVSRLIIYWNGNRRKGQSVGWLERR
jgi:hypothetical protein